MMTGYRVYSGRMRLSPGIYADVSVLMASIFDGWSNTERWYDLTLHSSIPQEYNRATEQRFVRYGLEV